MMETTQELPLPEQQLEKIPVLTVGLDEEARQALRGSLRHAGWAIRSVGNCQEALRLARREEPAVMVCEPTLEDGDWKDLLRQVSSLGYLPKLVLAVDGTDKRLWAEVLNVGGYDVLIKPFQPSEVASVIGMAWRNWRAQRGGSVSSLYRFAQPQPFATT